jgi:hypothetical protein
MVESKTHETEETMKQMSRVVGLSLLFFGALLGVAAAGPPDAAGNPTVYCNVVQEPNAHLLGGWKCVFPLHLESGELDINPAKYWLVKEGDRYALYFDRIARNGKKRYSGWKNWTIRGAEIDSGTGVRIYTQDGAVFFRWMDEHPAKMTRIDK